MDAHIRGALVLCGSDPEIQDIITTLEADASIRDLVEKSDETAVGDSKKSELFPSMKTALFRFSSTDPGIEDRVRRIILKNYPSMQHGICATSSSME
jgi:hypothetical protein